MSFRQFGAGVKAEDGNDGKVNERVFIEGDKHLNYFLSADGTESPKGGYTAEPDGPDLFGINLDDINEKDSIVVGDAKAGKEHSKQFGHVRKAAGAVFVVDDEKRYEIEKSWQEETPDSHLFSLGVSDEIAGNGISDAVRNTENYLEEEDVDFELVDGWVRTDIQRAQEKKYNAQVQSVTLQGLVSDEVQNWKSHFVLQLLVFPLHFHHFFNILHCHQALKPIEISNSPQTTENSPSALLGQVVGSVFQKHHHYEEKD